MLTSVFPIYKLLSKIELLKFETNITHWLVENNAIGDIKCFHYLLLSWSGPDSQDCSARWGDLWNWLAMRRNDNQYLLLATTHVDETLAFRPLGQEESPVAFNFYFLLFNTGSRTLYRHTRLYCSKTSIMMHNISCDFKIRVNILSFQTSGN